MIKAGIIGATGYAGQELVRLLLGHKDVEIKWYGSRSYVDQKFASVFGNFTQLVDDICKSDDLDKLADEVDVIFTATPQGYLQGILTEDILNKAKVVDLSADYRIKDVATYESWYGIEHKSTGLISEAVYGLCELNRDEIKNARLIANPGCYPTCSTFSIAPLAKRGWIDMSTLIIDAKSGTSGAGRGAKVPNLFCEVNENIKAYAVSTHRHTPEIEQTLSIISGEKVTLNFTPHLIPMNRGILITAYATVKGVHSADEIKNAYIEDYKDEYFVRVLDGATAPETKWVEGSNFTDVNVVYDERTNRVIMMGAMDNITKGAAGQAVQNMNLMFGLDEAEGLRLVPLVP